MEHDTNTEGPLEIKVVPPEFVELIDSQAGAFEPRPSFAPPRRLPRSRKRLVIFLFIATCLSTFLAGMGVGIPNPEWLVQQPGVVLKFLVINGLSYAGPLMLILLAHEMGHYIQSRRYGVPASLPYFIPMPFITPFGTMGAVIFQGSGVADRKALFDIAVSGPIAGLVLALPVTYLGLVTSQIVQLDPNGETMLFGDPLILQWMIEIVHRPLGPGEDVLMSPMLFAGWVGIFVTALNLIPIGQLDGGHILYTLVGRHAHLVAMALLGLALGYMIYTDYYAYSLMVVLLFLMGPRHPPTVDDTVPLGAGRVVLGWLALAFIIIGFTPTPLTITTGKAPELPPPRINADDPTVFTQNDAPPLQQSIVPSHIGWAKVASSFGGPSSQTSVHGKHTTFAYDILPSDRLRHLVPYD